MSAAVKTQLTSRHPVRITAEDEGPVTVTVTGASAYYADTSAVGSGDTEIEDGGTATFTSPQWMISASDSLVEQTPAVYEPGVVPAASIGAAEIADSAVTSAKIADGAIVNADVKSDAALAYAKLATLATGKIVAGNANVPTATTLGGDATIGATGTLTIADNAITQAKVGDDAAGAAELKITVEDVTVLATETTGTATVVADSVPLGIYAVSNQDQFVDSVAIATTVLTVTLAAAATANNVFKVPVLEP